MKLASAESTKGVIGRVLGELWARARRSPTETIREFLGETVWQWDLATLPPFQRRIVQSLRLLYLVGRGFVSSRAQHQAMALTYTTMLALVPTFAIIIAILSVKGLQQARGRLETFLIDHIAASPPQAVALTEWLNELAVNTQGGGGAAGAAFFVFLFFTIIALLGTLERTLNDIWGVKKERSFINRFVTYWCVATLGPILLGVALVQGSNLEYKIWEAADGVRVLGSGLVAQATPTPDPSPGVSPVTSSAAAEGPDDDVPLFGGVGGSIAREFERPLETPPPGTKTGPVASETPTAQEAIQRRFKRSLAGARTVTPAQAGGGTSIVSLVLTIITFTLLYAFLPNTQVRLKPALYGAITAAVLWSLTKWALTLSSTTLVSYNSAYGSMATIPITMFWLYLSWLIVILGAELAFALQNLKTQRKEELASETTALFKETVALRMCTAIADSFEQGDDPPHVEGLAELTGAPRNLCLTLLFHLTQDGILRESESREGRAGYAPARPIDKISVSDIVDSLRERSGIAFDLSSGPDLEVIQRHLDQANAASKALASRTSLRRVVLQLHEEIKSGNDHSVVPETAAAGAVSREAIRRISTTRLKSERLSPPSEED
ncbi:MAG: YihY family inner membrane protein, partial [Planctomycetes bacterium]|nr:YihY family inner membrane protein [Planctomycetota bacterium]